MITRKLDNICSCCATHRQKKFSVHRPYTPPYRLISQHPFATPPPSKTSSSCTSNTLHPHLIPHYATTSPIFHSPPPSIIAHTAASLPIAQNPPIQNPITNIYKPHFPASAQTPHPPTKYAHSQNASNSGFSLSNTTARDLSPHPEHPAPATSNSSSTASPGPPTILDILQRIPPLPPSRQQDISAPARCYLQRLRKPTIQLVRSQISIYFRNILPQHWHNRTSIAILLSRAEARRAGLVSDDFALQDAG